LPVLAEYLQPIVGKPVRLRLRELANYDARMNHFLIPHTPPLLLTMCGPGKCFDTSGATKMRCL
jgi:hypothetical protein